MIAAAIFSLLLLVLLSMFLRRPVVTISLFFLALRSVLLLFLHHATDALDISL